MYRIIIRGCAGLGAAIAAVYITALSLAVEDGSGGLEVSYRVNSVAIATISICVALSGGGWLTREIVRGEAARNRAVIVGELREEIEGWLARARTYGMVQQMGGHPGDTGNGSVSPMRRRDREEI